MTSFESAMDCPFQILLRAQDEVIPIRRLPGALVTIAPTRYRRNAAQWIPGVPGGVSLSASDPAVEFTTSLSWRPRVVHMGARFELCFRVQEANDLVLVTAEFHTERCFVVVVAKCRKCLSPGENLDTIATSLSSDWRLLWSANPSILNPSSVSGGRLIKTSLTYSVAQGDSLATIAMRFGTTVRALLAINPDLALEASLGTGTVVCVLPMPTSLDGCPTLAKSSTWEKMEEQYIAPDYYDNPFNWEEITYDAQGMPVKTRNPDYPQLPASAIGEEPGYSTRVA